MADLVAGDRHVQDTRGDGADNAKRADDDAPVYGPATEGRAAETGDVAERVVPYYDIARLRSAKAVAEQHRELAAQFRAQGDAFSKIGDAKHTAAAEKCRQYAEGHEKSAVERGLTVVQDAALDDFDRELDADIARLRSAKAVAEQHRELAAQFRAQGDAFSKIGDAKHTAAAEKCRQYAEGHEKSAVERGLTVVQDAALDDFDRELDALVGFCIQETKRKLEKFAPVPALDEAASERVTSAILTILNFETMYAAERVADKRWYVELRALDAQLKRFEPFAIARAQEDGYFAAHAYGSGRSHYSERAGHTGSVAHLARELANAIEAAKTQITRYGDDPLKAIDKPGAPSARVLAQVELALADAGLQYGEIAALVVELKRRADTTSQAGPHHLDRIRKRVDGARKAREATLEAQQAALAQLRQAGIIDVVADIRAARKAGRKESPP